MWARRQETGRLGRETEGGSDGRRKVRRRKVDERFGCYITMALTAAMRENKGRSGDKRSFAV